MSSVAAIAVVAAAVPLALGLFPTQKAVDPNENQNIEATLPNETPDHIVEPDIIEPEINHEEMLPENNMAYGVGEDGRLVYTPTGIFAGEQEEVSSFYLKDMPDGFKFVGWKDAEISYVVQDAEGNQYIIGYSEGNDAVRCSSMRQLTDKDEKYEKAANIVFTIEGGLFYTKGEGAEQVSTQSAFLLNTTGGAQYEFVTWLDASISYVAEDADGVQYMIEHTEDVEGNITTNQAQIEG
jgi:hypothetical protein